MGAYLPKPIFEPETICGSGRGMAFGASSVQGWRVTQEDAHNCILDFDEDCSLFAVYDGHGGSEVSKYCSLYLPGFIQKLSSYQAGDCKEALIDAFVKFDQTLTKPEVIEALKQLAQDMSDSDGMDTDEDERVVLAREAAMPLEDLIRCYKAHHKEKDGEKKSDSSTEANNGQPNEEKENQHDGNAEAESTPGAASDERSDAKADQTNDTATGTGKSEGTSSDDSNGVRTAAQSSEGAAPSSSEAADKDQSSGSSSAAGGDGASSSSAAAATAGSSAGSSSAEVAAASAAPGPASGRAAQRRATQRIRDRLNEAGEDCDDDEDDDDDDDDEDDDEDQDELAQDDGDDDDSDEDEDEPDSEEEDSDDELDDDEGRVGEDEDVETLDSDVPGSGSGCTAVVALIKGDVLTVANAGDSRAVLCRDGKAIDLSVDHKPEDAPERARIERAGGKVTCDGRVNGGLNLSRAIGDHVYKQREDLTLPEQMISPLPDVQTIMLDRTKDNFVILACDGIWNCMTSQEVCDFVTACIRNCDNLGQICEQLFRKCIAPDTTGDGTGCDNMTCIIVRLNTESLQDDDKAAVVPQNQATESTACNGGGGTSGGKRVTDEAAEQQRTKEENEQANKRQRVSS